MGSIRQIAIVFVVAVVIAWVAWVREDISPTVAVAIIAFTALYTLVLRPLLRRMAGNGQRPTPSS